MIRAEGLGKKYALGRSAERERYTALRDLAGRNIRGAWRRTVDTLRGHTLTAEAATGEFWALRDINFEVKRGDVVGIIGRNGAGKSTLLKILSRITEPSAGRVAIRGRVASLLEVGTGFHPELTGRENIFLNGAILGMSRAEIRRKFDEIVAFAEVEKFLDTPVKRYSSGMYVRLAFAVAGHLEPEILIVDEVLAVGDIAFQQKCLGKMDEVARRAGRTVLLVSHNLDQIARICRIALLLDGGKLVAAGPTADLVRQYLRLSFGDRQDIDKFRSFATSTAAEFLSICTKKADGSLASNFQQGESFIIEMRVRPSDPTLRDLGLVIENSRGQPLFATHLSDLSIPIRTDEPMTLAVNMTDTRLRGGDYLVSLASFVPQTSHFYDVVLHLPLFTIAGAEKVFPIDRRWGDLYFPINWTVAG